MKKILFYLFIFQGYITLLFAQERWEKVYQINPDNNRMEFLDFNKKMGYVYFTSVSVDDENTIFYIWDSKEKRLLDTKLTLLRKNSNYQHSILNDNLILKGTFKFTDNSTFKGILKWNGKELEKISLNTDTLGTIVKIEDKEDEIAFIVNKPAPTGTFGIPDYDFLLWNGKSFRRISRPVYPVHKYHFPDFNYTITPTHFFLPKLIWDKNTLSEYVHIDFSMGCQPCDKTNMQDLRNDPVYKKIMDTIYSLRIRRYENNEWKTIFCPLNYKSNIFSMMTTLYHNNFYFWARKIYIGDYRKYVPDYLRCTTGGAYDTISNVLLKYENDRFIEVQELNELIGKNFCQGFCDGRVEFISHKAPPLRIEVKSYHVLNKIIKHKNKMLISLTNYSTIDLKDTLLKAPETAYYFENKHKQTIVEYDGKQWCVIHDEKKGDPAGLILFSLGKDLYLLGNDRAIYKYNEASISYKCTEKKGFIPDEKELETQLNIYPNPTHSEFTIEFMNVELPNFQANVKILNILGQEIHNQMLFEAYPFSKHRLNVGYMSAGTYFVQVSSGDKTVTKKLVVTR